MTEPRRLREIDQGPQARLGRAVRAARHELVSTIDGRTAVYWALCRHLSRPPRPAHRGWYLAAATASLTLALAGLSLFASSQALFDRLAPRAPRDFTRNGERLAFGSAESPIAPATPWMRLDRGDMGTVEFAASADVDIQQLESRQVIRVQNGLLRAQVVKQDPLRPLNVVTPHLQVLVLGTRFDVTVDTGRTRVDLIEGHVRVETATGAVHLSAGESITSDDPRLGPVAGSPSAAASVSTTGGARASATPRVLATRRAPSRRDCDEERSPAGRLACLRVLASGNDLAAQNALFESGQMQEGRSRGDALALATYAEYARRFPDGYLAPEVSLHRLALLRGAGRRAEALEEACWFEDRFGDDPRVGQVTLTRVELSCGDGLDERAARDILDSLEASPKLRDAVQRVRERCGLHRERGGSAPDSDGPSEAAPPHD